MFSAFDDVLDGEEDSGICEESEYAEDEGDGEEEQVGHPADVEEVSGDEADVVVSWAYFDLGQGPVDDGEAGEQPGEEEDGGEVVGLEEHEGREDEECDECAEDSAGAACTGVDRCAEYVDGDGVLVVFK